MKARVLIVDDEKIIADLLGKVVSQSGMEVAGVSYSGDDAIAKLSAMAQKPNLVLMDYRMPGRNGLDTMAAMMDIDPTVRFIFVSADPTMRDDALRRGAVGFVKKPFVLRELKGQITAGLGPAFAKTADPDPDLVSLFRRAAALGYEVGARNHFEETGWVAQDKKELVTVGSAKGCVEEVLAEYERCKVLGKERRASASPGDASSEGGGGGGVGGGHSGVGWTGRTSPAAGSGGSSSVLVPTGPILQRQVTTHVDMHALATAFRDLSKHSPGGGDLVTKVVSRLVPMDELSLDGSGRELLERGLQSLVRNGWIDFYTVDEFDGFAPTVKVSIESAFARHYGASDEMVCAFLETVLSRLVSKALGRTVRMKEMECIAIGQKYCVFVSS